jgi:hypothetical protein
MRFTMAGPALPGAQRGKRIIPGESMTIEELIARESIRDTLAAYNMAGDRMKVEEFVGVFTPDAIYESSGFHLVGHDAIRGWLTGRSATADGPRVKFVRHNITTCKIDLLGPEEATARTYYSVNTDIGPDHCGYYVDRLRPVDGRWLIAHRKVRMDWVNPASVFVGQANRRPE